jgi:hypothetical protein
VRIVPLGADGLKVISGVFVAPSFLDV